MKNSELNLSPEELLETMILMKVNHSLMQEGVFQAAELHKHFMGVLKRYRSSVHPILWSELERVADSLWETLSNTLYKNLLEKVKGIYAPPV
jgi:hypothetical protein